MKKYIINNSVVLSPGSARYPQRRRLDSGGHDRWYRQHQRQIPDTHAGSSADQKRRQRLTADTTQVCRLHPTPTPPVSSYCNCWHGYCLHLDESSSSTVMRPLAPQLHNHEIPSSIITSLLSTPLRSLAPQLLIYAGFFSRGQSTDFSAIKPKGPVKFSPWRQN